MRYQLSLALCSDQLSLSVSEPPPKHSWGTALRALLGRNEARQPIRSAGGGRTIAQLSVALLPEGLASTLERVLANLKENHPQALKRADLSVQLGLAYARLGLLSLPEEGNAPIQREAIDRYVKAWIRQMWNMDPATQIVRWERAETKNQVLISCIDQTVYKELESFAGLCGLRFVSCLPAALNALQADAPQPHSAPGASTAKQHAESVVIVWSEPSTSGRRSPLVQLMHRDGSQPQALWRGWLPASGADSTQDDAVEGALRRFMAASKLPISTRVERIHWGQQAPSPASSGASA